MLDVNVWTNRLIGRDRELATPRASTRAWLAGLARAVTPSPGTGEREATSDAQAIEQLSR